MLQEHEEMESNELMTEFWESASETYSDLHAQQAAEEQRQEGMQVRMNDSDCIVCRDRERTHAIMPCGHRCVCEGCARELYNRGQGCPQCRGSMDSFLRIYD